MPHRRLQRTLDDVDPDLLIVVLGCQPVERFGGIEQSNTAARDDAFLDRRPRCVGRVIDPSGVAGVATCSYCAPAITLVIVAFDRRPAGRGQVARAKTAKSGEIRIDRI